MRATSLEADLLAERVVGQVGHEQPGPIGGELARARVAHDHRVAHVVGALEQGRDQACRVAVEAGAGAEEARVDEHVTPGHAAILS